MLAMLKGINTHRFLYAFSPKWLRISKGQLPIDYLEDYLTTWESLACTSFMGILIWLGEAVIVSRLSPLVFSDTESGFVDLPLLHSLEERFSRGPRSHSHRGPHHWWVIRKTSMIFLADATRFAS